MTTRPWMKWYPADWRAEPTLRMCSRAARSFWLDLLGLMHQSTPYGFLLISGISPTDKQLGGVTGDREADVTRWKAELLAAGVSSQDNNGVVYSRRMVRDHEKLEVDKAHGKAGGNPALIGRVNPPVKAHMPDTRYQKLEKKESNSDSEISSQVDREGRSQATAAPPNDASPNRTRGTRLPDDWTLPDDWRTEALARLSTFNLPLVDLDLEAEKFRNHWRAARGVKGVKLNWRATWFNWCLRASEQQPKGNGDGRRLHGPGRLETSLHALHDLAGTGGSAPRAPALASPAARDDPGPGTPVLGRLPHGS